MHFVVPQRFNSYHKTRLGQHEVNGLKDVGSVDVIVVRVLELAVSSFD